MEMKPFYLNDVSRNTGSRINDQNLNYEQFFEDDLEELDDDSEEIEAENYFLQLIKQKQEELSSVNFQLDHNNNNNNHNNDSIEGWNDLLMSITHQEQDFKNFDLLPFNIKPQSEIQLEGENSNQTIQMSSFLKTSIPKLEISEEVRDILSGMIASVEYISSLEFDKPISVEPIITVENSIMKFKDFDENSFTQPIQVDTRTLHDVSNLSDDLLKSESKYQESLQCVILEMEREMKEKESEYQLILLNEKKEREERRERVRRELERSRHQNQSAIQIQRHTRRYLLRKSYLHMKRENQQRIEMRREKEERNQMQREENYCREIERQRMLIEIENQRKMQKLLELENLQMRNEEMHMRKFLEEEIKEEMKRRIEQEEKKRKEKEEYDQRILAEQERLQAEQKAEQLRKEREIQEQKQLQEQRIREEQEKVELAKKEKREKELKESESKRSLAQQQPSKDFQRKNSEPAAGAKKTITGNLTSRKNGLSAWGGVIEEPQPSPSLSEDKNKNSIENKVPTTDILESNDDSDEENEQEMKSIENKQQPNLRIFPTQDDAPSHPPSNRIGPIVAIPSCDDISVSNRIDRLVRQAIIATKIPMKFVNTEIIESTTQNILSPSAMTDSIIQQSISSWKSYTQKHCHSNHNSAQTKFQGSKSHRHFHHSEPSHQQSNTTELKMSVENLQNLQFLNNYPALISLECNVNQISTLHEISRFSCSTSLTTLSLNDNQISSLVGLESYESLQSLHLDVNQLSDLTPIQHLPQLTTLSLKMNRFNSLPPLYIPTLQKLDLYHNRISTISSESLTSLTSLTHLDLGRNKLTTIDGEILSHCQLLTHLILSQNQLTQPPVPLYLPNLRFLWLSKNTITSLDSWIGEYATQPTASLLPLNSTWPVFLPLLEKLYLQDNEITTISSNALSTSPLLAELDASFNKVNDLDSIQGILTCYQLQKLQLQENPLVLSNNHNFIKQIQNNLINLSEFCGHSIDVRNCIYAPVASSSSLIAPLTPTEISNQKQILTKQRCEVIRNLKQNAWVGQGRGKGNLSDLFRLHVKSTDVLEHQPIQTTHQSSFHRKWQHLLYSLLGEQNIFKVREKSAKQSSETSTSHEQETLNFVQLLTNHCHLISTWNCTTENFHLINRVVYVSSSTLLPTALSIAPPVVEKRKDNKEYLAVVRARQSHSAMAIQSLWRGYIARKKLSFFLSHAKYYDADLETLMDAHNLTDYMGILNESLPELSDDWLSQNLGPSNGTNAMVYGDHKRKKITSPRAEHSTTSSSSSSRPLPSSHQHIPITPEKTNNSISPRGQFEAARNKSIHVKSDWVVDEKKSEILVESGVYITQKTRNSHNSNPKIHEDFKGEEEFENENEIEKGNGKGNSATNRPSSSSSSFSRPASSSSTISGFNSATSSQRFGKGEYRGDNDDIDMLLHTGRSRLSSNSSSREIPISEWGNRSNPPHSSTVHRPKQSIPQAIAEEKDPAVRYEKYSKIIANMGSSNVNVTKGNTKTSGSFGGKPKMVRSTQQRKHAPPAWLKGSTDDEK